MCRMVDLFMFALSIMNFLFMVGVICLVRKWRDLWRVAVALVGVSYLLILVWTGVDMNIRPSRHNLYPFEIAFWSGGGLVVLATMVLVHFIADHVVPENGRRNPSA